jgi:hypothetical protein
LCQHELRKAIRMVETRQTRAATIWLRIIHWRRPWE